MQSLRVDTGQRAIDKATADDFGRHEHLSGADQAQLVALAKRGDEQAKDRLSRAMLRYVAWHAKKYAGLIEFKDAIQEGNIGILRAIREYKFDKGAKFSTYASFWIKQRIIRAIEVGGLVRLPSHVSWNQHKVQIAADRVERETGERPSDGDAARLAGVGPSQIRFAEAPVKVYSFEDILPNTDRDDQDKLGRFERYDLENEDPTEEEVDRAFVAIVVRREIEKLPWKPRWIIEKRYGFDGMDELTLEQCGKRLRLTKERVRQIEEKTLDKLRHRRELRRVWRELGGDPDRQKTVDSKLDVVIEVNHD